VTDASEDLDAALERLASTERLLVALDFDGVLAPLVSRPEDARALPASKAAVLRLAALPDTTVGMISGRSMESLVHVTELPDDTMLIGSHGVEVRLDGTVRLALDDDEKERVSTLRQVLEEEVAGHDGVWVEVKPAGFAVHFRGATQEVGDAAQARARAAAGSLDGLTVRQGKNVLEFSVKSTTKGEGVELLREHTGATAVLFAGDDVTDEDGFAVLGPDDLGLKVGPGDTRAGFRVADPDAVAATLTRLADLRSAR
jgi:trehalose 6-phosphate phosphatase